MYVLEGFIQVFRSSSSEAAAPARTWPTASPRTRSGRSSSWRLGARRPGSDWFTAKAPKPERKEVGEEGR